MTLISLATLELACGLVLMVREVAAKYKCGELTGNVVVWHPGRVHQQAVLSFSKEGIMEDDEFPSLKYFNDRYHLILQRERSIKLLITKNLLDLNYTLFKISQDDFSGASAGLSGDTVGDEVELSGETNRTLPEGSHYFSAMPSSSGNQQLNNATFPFHNFAINITVIGQNCVDPISGNLCNQDGICAYVPSLDNQFACHCCSITSGVSYCSSSYPQPPRPTDQELVPILLSDFEEETAPPDQFCSKWYANCSERPCEHGICVQYAKTFQCYCKPGFDGECCQFDIDECLSNPCQHEGICYNLINGFKCSCLREWQGKFCEVTTKYSSCTSKSCDPGEVCVVDNGHILCVTNKSQLTQCYDNPCFNRGDCYLFQGSPYCICRPGFAGSYCENQEDIIEASLYKVHELTSVWVGIGVLVSAFLVVAVVLLVCHCHTYSCQMKIPYRRYENEEQERISRSGPGYNGADEISIAFTDCTPSVESAVPLHAAGDTQTLMTKSV